MESLQTREAQVRSTLDGFFQASVAKNGAFMTEHLHDEFVFISPKSIELRKKPFTNDFVLNPAVHLEVFEPQEQQISIVGDTALAAGVAQAKFKDAPLFKVRTTMTFVHLDAGWKLLGMQETYLP
jgi:hypothetical protein